MPGIQGEQNARDNKNSGDFHIK